MSVSTTYKGLKWTIGDASNPAAALLVDNTSRALHMAEAADAETDWNVAANTHPTLYIHSATTPATDYILMYHDATIGYLDVVGGTTLRLLIAGTAEIDLTASALSPAVTDSNALGTTALMWSDLFLASGAVINFNNGDVTLTHSANSLAIAGGTSYTFDAVIEPSASDGAALGAAAIMWSDLFLASGAVINFNNGDVTLTHAANALSLAGGDLFLRGGNAIITKHTTSSITTAGAGTYTAAQLYGGRITRDPTGAARTDTTDTAANIVGAIVGAAVGDTFICIVENTADAAEAITLAGGSGVTLERLDGTGATIPQNGTALLLFVLTNVTGASEAVSCYVIAS